VAFLLSACGSTNGPATPPDTASAAVFSPPPAGEGYTRLVAKKIPDIKPGADITYCQYVMPALDHDVDILSLTGYQSAFGHHIVAFSFADDGTKQIGESFPCMGTEVSSGSPGGAGLDVGSYLGGIAGANDKNNSGSPLPEGVAFRLKTGNGIMLNVHFLNTGDKTVDGNGVIDVKLAEPDPNRLIASMFVNVNLNFDLAPKERTDSSVECVAQKDTQIIMASNHMHEYGVAASSEVVRAGSTVAESLHDDPTWTYDMQFNIVYSRWPAATPYVVHAGDTIRTNCSWQNTTANALTFPREMCVGIAFVLVSGDNPKAPGCVNGTWKPELL
jgi:hypothetical protein